MCKTIYSMVFVADWSYIFFEYSMKVGDLVALKHSPWLTLGIVVKLGGDEDGVGFEDWAAVLFIDEKGPGWWEQRNLEVMNESR